MTAEEFLQQIQSRGMVTEAVANRLRRDSLLSGKSAEMIIGEERIVPDADMAKLKSELLKVPYKKFDPKGSTQNSSSSSRKIRLARTSDPDLPGG